jgi:hypothetical protein
VLELAKEERDADHGAKRVHADLYYGERINTINEAQIIARNASSR